MQFIETPIKPYRRNKNKKININGADEVSIKNLRTTVDLHRKTIKSLKRDIKRQKLLIKQARLNYKLNK